jgi:hypothetical protein
MVLYQDLGEEEACREGFRQKRIFMKLTHDIQPLHGHLSDRDESSPRRKDE